MSLYQTTSRVYPFCPWTGLGLLEFSVFHCLPNSAWAGGGSLGVAGQMGKMVEHPNQSQPNPGPRAERTPWPVNCLVTKVTNLTSLINNRVRWRSRTRRRSSGACCRSSRPAGSRAAATSTPSRDSSSTGTRTSSSQFGKILIATHFILGRCWRLSLHPTIFSIRRSFWGQTRGRWPYRSAVTRAMRNRHVMLYDLIYH